uniref:Uncharacterized protein n=1 Tax=Nelumbo nucifera TaxID=4432 RepID=A0A822Z0G6_NELNU|nr:TPA_asm: hypothetical protein HUJ06_007616 [Nelumbo nucifera]
MSAYSCRLDVGHEIHHYTEQITGIHISVKRDCARFSHESPSARYGIQGLNVVFEEENFIFEDFNIALFGVLGFCLNLWYVFFPLCSLIGLC